MKEGGFTAPACFHLQQMIEKYLKGLLIFYDKSFPRTHDLVKLASLLESFVPEIDKHAQDFALLSPMYIETRYPGDYPEFDRKECEKAFEAAQRIKKFVLKRIKLDRAA